MVSQSISPIRWPDGKRFAFTIFDDTDHCTMANGPVAYDFLKSLGMRTTKSVWPIQGPGEAKEGGSTCEEADYRDWTLQLRDEGFEIALHNVTYNSSKREQILRGLESYRQIYGEYPRIQVNHSDCRDCLYWGHKRVSGLFRLAYTAATRFRKLHRFQGEVKGSPYYWGDMSEQHIDYVRNFVFKDINTLKCCPQMPYHDRLRPLVKQWFASAEGGTLDSFCRTLDKKNQQRLEEEGGACIMYAHLGNPGFVENGELNPRFRELMESMSARAGWFVPVSTLLDYIREQRGEHCITAGERFRLEWQWFANKFATGGTS